MEELKPNSYRGWICPVCGAGVSPFRDICPCVTRQHKMPEVNIQTLTLPNTGTVHHTQVWNTNEYPGYVTLLNNEAKTITTYNPNVHCGGLVRTKQSSVVSVNLGDKHGYLKGQSTEELDKLPVVTFPLPGTQFKSSEIKPVKEAE